MAVGIMDFVIYGVGKMEIDVTGLRKSPGETLKYHFEEEFMPLNVDNNKYIFKGPVILDLSLSNTGRLINARGIVLGALELQCGRCLEPFEFTIRAEFEENYCQESEFAQNDETGIDIEECHLIKSDKIDFTEAIYETMAMNFPMKPTCSENCQGICPICGQNLNLTKCNCQSNDIDPRLEVLKKLL